MNNDEQLYSRHALKKQFGLKPAPGVSPKKVYTNHYKNEVELYDKADCIETRKPKTEKMKFHSAMLGINNKLRSKKGKNSAKANIVLRKNPIYVATSDEYIFILETINSKNKTGFVRKEDAKTLIGLLAGTTVVVYDLSAVKKAFMDAGCEKLNEVRWIEFDSVCPDAFEILDASNLSSFGEFIRLDIMQRKLITSASYNKKLLKEHRELFDKKLTA